MSDCALEMRVTDAMDSVFEWMAYYIGYDRETGTEALAPYGFDWVAAWQSWWDGGEPDAV